MINEISLNSSNTIELSRSELLNWLNEMLNSNVAKIQQLGTGAHYCQMLELLYPGKVQLSKVNFKAKNDYEYINNFKVLQQYFTKFSIMKNIEVEKLIKCKYQDNLEFLQWFKKIFDNHFVRSEQEHSLRRSTSDNNDLQLPLEKQNKRPTRALNFSQTDRSTNSMNEMLKLQFSKQGGQKLMHSTTSRPRTQKQNSFLQKPSTDRNMGQEFKNISNIENMQLSEIQSMRPILPRQGSNTKQPYYSPSKYIQKQRFYRMANDKEALCNQEKQFYLKKFKEIQHLLEFWQNNEHCSKLVEQVRKIILIPPQVKQWTINEQTGQVTYKQQTKAENTVQGFNQQLDPVQQLSKFQA